MKMLTVNAGSSSVKFSVFERLGTACGAEQIFKAQFERFTEKKCRLHYRIGGESAVVNEREDDAANVAAALDKIPSLLVECGIKDIQAVGHRIAHGGAEFREAVIIDDAVTGAIEQCVPLAPLHNPLNLAAVAICRAAWPDLPHVAVFDTAFHSTIPERAYSYAVPHTWRDAGLRRYGFHGTSHKYVAFRAAEALGAPVTDLRIVSCHLGNGASVCAINRGFSIDTSMGMTALEGLVMGTRSGDVDPGIFLFLQREMGLSAEVVEQALYQESGLKALAGTHDMRDIEHRAAQGDPRAQLAINVYAYRVRKYIGAYAAAMGGLDVLAFTGGIGENSATMRRRVCDRFEFLGMALDEDRNIAVDLHGLDAPQIESEDSRVKVIVTQASEQYMIAQEAWHVLERKTPPPDTQKRRIPIAVSARHVHLSADAVERLFGAGYELKMQKKLSQYDGWAAEETVDVIGPKGVLRGVRVMGPRRRDTQIEISKTDSFTLGIDVPVRPSGMLGGTPPVRLRGPAGEVTTGGLIIAARHIHMSPEDAAGLCFADGDYVDVKVGESARPILFSNVMIRVKQGYVTEMHIDTDEANAAGIPHSGVGEILFAPTEHHANIVSCKNLRL